MKACCCCCFLHVGIGFTKGPILTLVVPAIHMYHKLYSMFMAPEEEGALALGLSVEKRLLRSRWCDVSLLIGRDAFWGRGDREGWNWVGEGQVWEGGGDRGSLCHQILCFLPGWGAQHSKHASLDHQARLEKLNGL